MRISSMFQVVAGLLVAGCGGDKTPPPAETPPLEQVLPNIPFPPDAQTVSSERTPQAMRLVLASSSPADTVVAYYRSVLSAAPYRLINEAKAGNVTSFYVEQDGPAMWVTVQPVDSLNSLVTIAGAKSDSIRVPDPAVPEPVGASGQPLRKSESVPLPEQGGKP